VFSEWTQSDSEWDPSDSGVDLLFDLDVVTSLLFVDGDGPSDQFFIDVDTGRIHAESLRVFQHPEMHLYTAVRTDLFTKGHGAWVPIMNSQVLNILEHSFLPKNYQLCWYSTNATTKQLQSGGVHDHQVMEVSSIGCFHLSLNLRSLFGDVFQPMHKRECWQKYAHRGICNTHTITIWRLAPIVDDVATVVPQEHDQEFSFITLHVGSIYRIKFKFAFEILQTNSSFLIVEKDVVSLVVFRNKINFVYLVQDDGFCDISHLRHTDAEALVVQWKEEHDCEGCFFFPDSTVNEGRNELWYRTFEKWPGTVFTYYIFLDGDVILTLRPDRNKLFPQLNASSESIAFRVFEQHLLQYRPAVAVPFHSNWHVDNGSDVQFVSNFDHIVLAVHAGVSRMLLPTETRFDHKSWWWAQRVWGFMCAVAFPQQTLQINAVASDNGHFQMRSVSMTSTHFQSDGCSRKDARTISSGTKKLNQSAAVGTKKYLRDNHFEYAFLWFMASLKKDLASILPDFQTNPSLPQPSSRAMLQAAQTDGMFRMAVLTEFTKTFDYSHPYWLNHRFLLVTNRTFTGFLSPCIYFSDVGECSKDSCEKIDADWHAPTRIEVETLMLVMNLNQMVLEQNQAITRLINAFEKRSEQ